jgi:hypothetical protein
MSNPISIIYKIEVYNPIYLEKKDELCMEIEIENEMSMILEEIEDKNTDIDIDMKIDDTFMLFELE